eukprot:scaffold13622_cov131-Skeletonema_marinoi.AAC.1
MSDVLIPYQISNEFSPAANNNSTYSGYNAFYLPRKNNGVTLSSIKSHIQFSLGHDQFHWRVRIDDRPATSHSSDVGGSATSVGNNNKQKYSWWDIQDENARLPIKEASAKELKKMFGPPKKEELGDVTQEVTKAAKGAMKYMGKAMNVVAGSHGGGGGGSSHHHHHGGGYEDDGMEDDFGQRTAVICFKVLDLNRVRMGCNGGGGGGGGVIRRASAVPRRTSSTHSTPAPPQQQQRPTRGNRAPASAGAPRIPSHRSSSAASSHHATPVKTSAPTGNLMDFGSTSTASSMSTPQQQRTSSSSLHHANSMPSSSSSKSTPTGKAHPNETRAEKLKREYAKKNAQSNRVWDEVDQRWVEGTSKNGEISTSAAASRSTSTSTATSATPNNNMASSVTKSVKGISLSTTNAIGKSAQVQAAVHARVAEMESSQQKALFELRNRETAKANADAEEDVVRQRLEPKLKAWSEEHGQKKQLRALLANLHTILWEGSGWKQVSLADVLDDSKVKRVYHKASRVVHPDKTLNLDAEKKFVAKRVFDALTQAKVAFDEGTK